MSGTIWRRPILLPMSAPLQFPQFDPVLLHLGPIQIRWYALAYITGLVTGWQVMRRLVRLPPAVASVQQTDDFLTWRPSAWCSAAGSDTCCSTSRATI